MDWLHDHVTRFILPALRLLATGRSSIGATEVTGEINNLRPAKAAWCKEAGLIYTALRSWGIKSPIANPLFLICEPALFMNHERMATFEASRKYKPEDVVHSIVKNSWKALKRRSHGKVVLLTGRDVWLWKVMSEKYPGPQVVFDPIVSRSFVNSRFMKERMDSWNVDYSKCIVFDTGFAGSIHRAMCRAVGVEMENIMLSTDLKDPAPNGKQISCQIFPNHTESRAKALHIEYLPKYWKSGTVKGGYYDYDLRTIPPQEPIQYLADLDEFLRAAAQTLWFWHHQSPKFVEHVSKRARAEAASKALGNWDGKAMLGNWKTLTSMTNVSANWNTIVYSKAVQATASNSLLQATYMGGDHV